MDIKYAYYNTSKGYRVVGGTAAHFLKADGSLDNTEYIDKTSFQDIAGTKRFYTFGGNNYDNNSLHIASSDGSDPALTFNKIGTIAGQIKMNVAGYHFLNPGLGYYPVNAAGYVKSGSNDSYVLLGGGGHIPVSSFTSSKYLDYIDDRKISPSEIEPLKLRYGFTSWDQNNNAPWADFLHFGGYTDASGGDQNLIVFNKNGFGIRQYLGNWQDSSPYTAHVDYWHTGNFNPNNYVDKTSSQDITGIKAFYTYLGGDVGNNRLWIRSSDGSNPAISFIKDGVDNSQLAFDGFGLHFKNTNSTGYFPIKANGFIKNGYDDDFVLLAGGSAKSISDFAEVSQLGNYVTINTPQTIIADKSFSQTAKLTIHGNEFNLNNTQSYNTTSGNGNISAGWVHTFYDSRWKYGIVRGGDSSADGVKFGFDFSSDGGAYNRMLSIDANSGSLELNKGGNIDGQGNITVKPVTNAPNATGLYWKNKNGSGDFIASTGIYSVNGDYQYSYMGWGTSPWGSNTSLIVADSLFTYKGNNVLHAGNFNPDSKDSAWLHSGRDFTQGTRILTNIDYSQWSGAAFLVEIKGNMYGGGMVMDCKIQGYIYNDTIINAVGYSTHPLLTEIIALNLNGELCFWFPRLSYWQGFSVKVTDVTSAGVTTTTNRAYQIADAADPGGIKRVRIPIATIATQNWINGQSFVTTNTVQAITALKEFYTTLAMANGQSIYLKGSSDTAHYIRHFSDDTDGFGVSSGFAVKNYSTLENLFQVTSTGFGEFKQNVRAGGFLKAGSSNNFVLLGYGDHKPLSDFWTSANFNPATKVNTWENAYALGFSSGLSTGTPYIYHATDGYVFLATQSWVSSNFANQIQLNVEFTTNLGTGLMLSDDKIGGESGLIDIHQKAFIAGKIGEYYKYGSSIDGLEGINYDLGKKNIGIGGDIDSNKVRVEGCVKAIGNFKSEEEKPDTMFIPDGQIATLRDEIVNAKYAIRLNPHEYGIDAYSTLDVDDRNRLIHIVADQVDMRVNFNKIYPKQQIVIYNFDQKGNGLEVQINGKTIYYIEQHCFLRLYITNSLRVIAERQQPCDFVW